MKIKSKVFWPWSFKDKNIKPTLCTILVAVLIVVGAIKFYYYAVALDNEFGHLAKHGRILSGEIIKFEPYLRHRSSEGGPTEPLKGIAVKIKSKDLDESIFENWDYRFKDSYHIGDTVRLYYDEENKRIKVASENHKDLPRLTK